LLDIVLVQPEIPQNTGNIGRTCIVTGSRLHLVGPLGFSVTDTAVKRAGLEGAMIQREYAKVRDSLETEAHLSVWKLGPVGLVTIPGELFSSLGQKIKGESPSPATIVAGYSNGYIGYIPDQEAYEQGGYETLSSPLLMGFGEDLAAAAVDGLREVTNKQR